MAENEELISLKEAKKGVALVCQRLGLLHLAFAEVLVRELGEEKGKIMIAKAIKEYGKKIGEKERKMAISKHLGLTRETFRRLGDLPAFGMHERRQEVQVEGEKRTRAYGCVMAKVWHEYGKDALGRIYCYVDPAKSMAFNPKLKLIHTKTMPDGNEFCELVMRPTTEEDRENFLAEGSDWASIDK